MGVFDNEMYLNPKYNHLERFAQMCYRSFWTPAKYEQSIRKVDVPHIMNIMSELDSEPVKRCIMAVALVEDKVKNMFPSLSSDLVQTIISDICAMIGQQEVTHRRSYHSLNEALGINVDDLKDYDALKGRIKYLNKHLEKDSKIIGKKRVLKKLVLFTSLVERISLYTSFYILMSYAHANKGLKTISALQSTTCKEEKIHYEFGLALINIIKEEYPQLWDEYLVEMVEKNIKDAYKAERSLLDWFFEKGVPDHLTMDEVVNFLNNNFNTVINDLGLNIKPYKVDEHLWEERNSWFDATVFMTAEPDFFDMPDGSYADEQEEIDINNFEF